MASRGNSYLFYEVSTSYEVVRSHLHIYVSFALSPVTLGLGVGLGGGLQYGFF